MEAKRLLLLDAEGPLRRTWAEQLTGLGYAVDLAATQEEALAGTGACDLLLVAGPVAGMDQQILCEAWSGAGAAVLVLADTTAAATTAEQTGALALVKPVRLGELARVIKDALRVNAAPDFDVGPLRFHPPTRELSGPGARAVRLTEKEAAILSHLRRAEPAAVARDELLAQIWGYASAIATHTLETHVYRLRRKLAEVAPAGPKLVSDGNGYRLETAQGPASTAR